MSNVGIASRLCYPGWKLCKSFSRCRNNTPRIRGSLFSPVESKSCHPCTYLTPVSGYSHYPAGNSTSTGSSVDTTQKKTSGPRLHKLHNRKLTQEEKDEDASLKLRFANLQLAEEDAFGRFRRGNSQRRAFSERTGATDEETKSVSNLYEIGLGSRHNVRKQPRNKYSRLVSRDADTFGTLQTDDFADRIQESLTSTVGSHEERLQEDADEIEDVYNRSDVRLSAFNRRHIPDWYGRKITKLNKKGKVREAIEVFEEWMLKKDRVMPNAYVFTSLISGLGHAGYTKKAFHLFNKMKKMGIKPKPQTYTALFNACANSPWRQDGLTRADNLYHLMQEQGVEPTVITGKAMIKAFAVCGDVRRAFALMDEMSSVHVLDAETFSFLLMACVSDKEAGLRHAFQVWRLMLTMKVQPDLPLYNLLIRCVRDCGVGDATSVSDLLGQTTSQTSRQEHEKQDADGSTTVLLSPEGSRPGDVLAASGEMSGADICKEAENICEKERILSQALVQQDSSSSLPQAAETSAAQGVSTSTASLAAPSVPDLLSPSCDVSRVVSLGDLTSKESHLALVGGVAGILGRMVEDGVKPNIVTFSQLISVAVPTVRAEEQVLELMRKMKVKPDIDLLNALIHKRCMRRDFAAAKDVQRLMAEYKLTANQRTFGVLALTCRSRQEGEELLQDMETAELLPNMEILGSLIYAAGTNFSYMLWILREAEKLNLPPNTQFLRNIEKTLAHTRKMIVQAEKKQQTDSYFLGPSFQRSWERFLRHYEKWLQRTGVEVPPHPWSNFRPASDDKERPQAAETV